MWFTRPTARTPEHGEGVGHLYAIDATKRGDITKTGQLWHYDKIRRSISTGAVYNGLLFLRRFQRLPALLGRQDGKTVLDARHAGGDLGLADGDRWQGISR